MPVGNGGTTEDLDVKPNRLLRVGELMKRELGMLVGPLSDEYRSRMVTVTEVRLSRDLRYADVWVSLPGDEAGRTATVRQLSTDAWRIRKQLAGRVYLRHLPELRFALDETLDRTARIDDILRESGVLTADEAKADESE